MKARALLATLLAGLTFGRAEAMEPGVDAAAIGEAYCAARMARDEAATRALLSPGLLAAIAEAEDADAVFEAANPGDKPPLGDGIPYETWQDTPGGCAAQPGGGDPLLLAIRFVHDTGSLDGWTDTLVLVEETAGLRIDDILYERLSPDHEQHTLRSSLAWVLTQRP